VFALAHRLLWVKTRAVLFSGLWSGCSFHPGFPVNLKGRTAFFSFGREGGKVRMNAYFTSFLFHAEGVAEKGVDFL
jgi:hypothetical protein